MTEDRKLPEGQSQQPPYVPIPAYYLQGDPDDQINWTDYIRVLWRRKFLILLGTLLCALTAFVVTVTVPPVYQSRATLILQPPQFPTKVTPAPLSVETVKTMLESDSIASKLRSQLLEKNVIQPDSPIEQIKDMLSVEIPAENEPLIDLVVESDSPEKAEIVANTWAEIFVVESACLAQSGQQATLDFIESQYSVVKNTLMDRQSEFEGNLERYEQALLSLDKSWSSPIVSYTKETDRLVQEREKKTERLVQEHQKQTQKLQLEFISRWKPDLLKAELKIQETKLTKFQDELLETEIAIRTKRDTLTQIKKEIQTQPQYLVLSKAITDEALWERIGDPQGRLPEELNQIKLRSELLNPTYQNLLNRLTTTQIDYDTLVPKNGHLQNELERIRKSIDELDNLITEKELVLFVLLEDRELELFDLNKDSALELKDLKNERQAELEILQKTYASEMSRLRRERDFQENELTREVNAARRAYEPVAENYRNVELAKVQQQPYVKIGALAVAPGRPLARRTGLNTLIALVVGFMLSVMLAFVFEYAQSMSLTDSSEREIKVSSSRSPEYELDSPSTTHRKLAGR